MRIVLDAGVILGCPNATMKKIFFAAVAGAAIIGAGCVSTVSNTKTATLWFNKDEVQGRYQRPVDQVYRAAVKVITDNGVMITEYIPHDVTNTVLSLQGRVNQRNVWIRVTADPQPGISDVTVQARSKVTGDADLAHELEKEIALKLIASP